MKVSAVDCVVNKNLIERVVKKILTELQATTDDDGMPISDLALVFKNIDTPKWSGKAGLLIKDVLEKHHKRLISSTVTQKLMGLWARSVFKWANKVSNGDVEFDDRNVSVRVANTDVLIRISCFQGTSEIGLAVISITYRPEAIYTRYEIMKGAGLPGESIIPINKTTHLSPNMLGIAFAQEAHNIIKGKKMLEISKFARDVYNRTKPNKQVEPRYTPQTLFKGTAHIGRDDVKIHVYTTSNKSVQARIEGLNGDKDGWIGPMDAESVARNLWQAWGADGHRARFSVQDIGKRIPDSPGIYIIDYDVNANAYPEIFNPENFKNVIKKARTTFIF